jgi:hypothetical protein
MEDINDIAHFAKGSMILKNHYAISDPQKRIHSPIGNAISSDKNQESTSVSSSSSPSFLSSSLAGIPYISNERLNTISSSQNGISSEVLSNSIVPFPFPFLTSPKVVNLAHTEGNNILDNKNLENSNIKLNNLDNCGNNSNNSNVENNTSERLMESKKIIEIRKGVRSKQLDLLPPEYLIARLNNAKVINVKHPSLLPFSKPNRNPSQVSSSVSSNDEDSFLSDSNSDSKSDLSVFSSDDHISEEKTDWVN